MLRCPSPVYAIGPTALYRRFGRARCCSAGKACGALAISRSTTFLIFSQGAADHQPRILDRARTARRGLRTATSRPGTHGPELTLDKSARLATGHSDTTAIVQVDPGPGPPCFSGRPSFAREIVALGLRFWEGPLVAGRPDQLANDNDLASFFTTVSRCHTNPKRQRGISPGRQTSLRFGLGNYRRRPTAALKESIPLKRPAKGSAHGATRASWLLPWFSCWAWAASPPCFSSSAASPAAEASVARPKRCAAMLVQPTAVSPQQDKPWRGLAAPFRGVTPGAPGLSRSLYQAVRQSRPSSQRGMRWDVYGRFFDDIASSGNFRTPVFPMPVIVRGSGPPAQIISLALAGPGRLDTTSRIEPNCTPRSAIAAVYRGRGTIWPSPIAELKAQAGSDTGRCGGRRKAPVTVYSSPRE